jgi:Nitroreductase family
MLTRRQFYGPAAVLTGGLGLPACSASGESYDDAVQRIWRLGDGVTMPPTELQRELVRLATLAPSSHNTQCWRFATPSPQRMSILPDPARRCPAVDPDDHHLYVSLGCAAENLAQGALAHGLRAQTAFDAQRNAVGIALEPTSASSTPLFKAIAERQCTRGEYDGKPLSADELATLAKAAASDSVELMLLTDKPAMERVLEFVIQGNTAQMNDPAFVNELKAWIRFSGADAVRLGDGLYAASSGNPVLPSWLGRVLFGFVFKPKAENDKYAKHLRSSAGVAVFTAKNADKANWVEVGRAYERFALQAAALGIRNAMLNQPVEVASLRDSFASAVGVAGRRPDLVVRFGRGPKLPPSLRRPVTAVLV